MLVALRGERVKGQSVVVSKVRSRPIEIGEPFSEKNTILLHEV